MKLDRVTTAMTIVWGVVILASALVLTYSSHLNLILLILGGGATATLVILGTAHKQEER
jgi:hypothetical protein